MFAKLHEFSGNINELSYFSKLENMKDEAND